MATASLYGRRTVHVPGGKITMASARSTVLLLPVFILIYHYYYIYFAIGKGYRVTPALCTCPLPLFDRGRHSVAAWR